MQILVCIDDTDNLSSPGTGKLASRIVEAIVEQGWGESHWGITRHQLLVHPDVPYTSHNSCMCFNAEIEDKYLRSLIDFASEFLQRESAEGSDPGLCVAIPDRITKLDSLIDFGYRAKEAVLIKEEAYNLANKLGIHLSEHGGTGQGVIGALAGVGLRLSGNDGRFRGKHQIGAVNQAISVRDACAQTNIDLVRSLDGIVLMDDEVIHLGEKVKTVLMDGKSILLVYPFSEGTPDGVKWQTCTKQQLKRF